MQRITTPLWLVRGLLSVAALSALAACTSTSLVEQWQDQDFKGPALQRLLVVSVHKSDGRRRIFEDAMVSALAKQGVSASASYKLLADAVPERAAVSTTAAANNFDGVLIMHQVDQGARSYRTAGATTYVPIVVPTADGKYAEYWQAVYQPGYSEVETLTDYQADVFSSGNGGKLIWTGTTRSVDLSSANLVSTDIARRIVPVLTRIGALSARTP